MKTTFEATSIIPVPIPYLTDNSALIREPSIYQIYATLEDILQDLSRTGHDLNSHNVRILAECRYGAEFASIVINHLTTGEFNSQISREASC